MLNDTKSVFIPKYKELSEEEKAVVEQLKAEILIIRRETRSLVSYEKELAQEVDRNQQIISNLLYQSVTVFRPERAEEMEPAKMIKMRLEVLRKQEEMNVAYEKMQELRKQAVLRTVAMQEIEREEKRIVHKLTVFRTAERIKQEGDKASIALAKGRMIVTVKVMEQQIEAVKLAMQNESPFVVRVEAYQAVLDKLEKEKGKDLWKIRKESILDVLAEQREICKYFFSDEEKKILKLKPELSNFNAESEKKIICVMADIGRTIDKYAMENKDKLEELAKELEAIQKEFAELQKSTALLIEDERDEERKRKSGKLEAKREQLLRKIRKVQLGYQIFQNQMFQSQVEEAQLQEMYATKFNILAFQQWSENPFEKIKTEEREQYIRTIEQRLEKLFTTESCYSNAYNLFITYIKNFLKQDKSIGMAENALNNIKICSFLVDIADPNLAFRQFYNDNDKYLIGANGGSWVVELKKLASVQDHVEVIQFLMTGKPWQMMQLVKDSFKGYNNDYKFHYARLAYALMTMNSIEEQNGVISFKMINRWEYFLKDESLRKSVLGLKNCFCLKDVTCNIADLVECYPNIKEIEFLGRISLFDTSNREVFIMENRTAKESKYQRNTVFEKMAHSI